MPVLKRMLIESSKQKKTKINMFSLSCKMLYVFIFPLWSHLPKHTPAPLPTRYSNERTFLEWIHFATILAAAGQFFKMSSDQGKQLKVISLHLLNLYEMCRSVGKLYSVQTGWLPAEASWCYTQPKRPILLMYRIDFHRRGCIFNLAFSGFSIYHRFIPVIPHKAVAEVSRIGNV